MFKVAAIQMVSGADLSKNLNTAKDLIGQAATKGAKLIVLPENFAFMGKSDQERIAIAEEFGNGRIQNFLSALARELKLYLVAGSLALQSDDPQKIRSTSLVYDPQGECIAHYDKIHMFDVKVEDNFGKYQESDSTRPGEQAVVVKTELGNIGLSICYDLRFPEHYRALLAQGADIILVPSAFTKVTGEAHWETLLRARAIENLSYVIAPNQGGEHENTRQTYGHSMVISPWGEVLACVALGEGIAMAEIDLKQQQKQRQNFPAIATALELRKELFRQY